MTMPAVGIDAQLFRIQGTQIYDVGLAANGDLSTNDAFDTAIFVSLFTDARASYEQVPQPELRRGWHGDERTPGFQLGGFLWLWEQPRSNAEAANGIAVAAEGSLRWMVDGGYAVTVRATAEPFQDRIELRIELTSPSGEVEDRLFTLWNQTGKLWGEVR